MNDIIMHDEICCTKQYDLPGNSFVYFNYEFYC